MSDATTKDTPNRRGASFTRYSLMLVGCIALGLILLNLVFWQMDLRADLTANQRFSVTDAGTEILREMPQPLNLTYYVSEDRPSFRASLERDVVQRLSAIADAADGKVGFNADEDVVIVTTANEPEVRKQGVQLVQEQLASGVSVAYYSSIRITYAEKPEPTVIPVTSATSLEYDLISQAVRLRMHRRQPSQPREAFKAISRDMRITLAYAIAPEAPADSQSRRRAELIMDALRGIWSMGDSDDANAKLKEQFEIKLVSDTKSNEFRKPDGGADFTIIVKDKERGGIQTIGLKYSETMSGQDAAQKLLQQVATAAWTLQNKLPTIGVWAPNYLSRGRPEITRVEERLYVNLSMYQGLPEYRLKSLLERLGFETQMVSISTTQRIPLNTLGALVILRPSNLIASDLHEIQHFMASGGRVLVFAGEWHVPLLDNGLGINDAFQNIREFWLSGDVNGELSLRRVGGGLAPLLKEYGVGFDDGLLVSEQGAEYSVYTPQAAVTDEEYLDPTRTKGALGLIPRARPQAHVLATEVSALPLRGGQPIELDQETLEAHGLMSEVIFTAREDTHLLELPDDDRISIKYTLGLDAGADELLTKQKSQGDPEPAGGLPVGVRITGQFPFDPSKPGPVDAEGKRTPAIGDQFKGAPGELIVISSPNLIESIDLFGWNASKEGEAGSAGLVEGMGSPVFQSVQQVVANVMDAFLFGDAVIEVRRSQLPPPRKVEPWTSSERTQWTLLCVLMLPLLAIGLGSAWNSRRKSLREAALKG